MEEIAATWSLFVHPIFLPLGFRCVWSLYRRHHTGTSLCRSRWCLVSLHPSTSLASFFLPFLPPARPLSSFPAIFMPCVMYMIVCISVKSNYRRQEKICYSSFWDWFHYLNMFVSSDVTSFFRAKMSVWGVCVCVCVRAYTYTFPFLCCYISKLVSKFSYCDQCCQCLCDDLGPLVLWINTQDGYIWII